MQWNWTLHSQGPDEPVYVIEADGTARFVARLDGEGKTRAEVMENGFLLAAAPALFAALEDLTDRVDLVLYASFVGHERIARARAAIAKAKATPCDRNETVPTGDGFSLSPPSTLVGPMDLPEPPPDRILCGIFPCGVTWADRAREEHGDYKRLAFLPYCELVLKVEPDCPADLREQIEKHAAEIIARRGERFAVSATGQCVTLGE